MNILQLRCYRCGWQLFKLSAEVADEKSPSGDVKTECARCGFTEVGYIPAVDPLEKLKAPQQQTDA